MLLSKLNKLWHKFSGVKAMARLSIILASISGVFCLVVCFLMISAYVKMGEVNPFNHAKLLSLKQSLFEDRQNQELKTEMVEFEILTQKEFFVNQAWVRDASFFLIVGILVLLVSSKMATEFCRRIPEPSTSADGDIMRAGRIARIAVTVFAIMLMIVLLVIAYLSPKISLDNISSDIDESMSVN